MKLGIAVYVIAAVVFFSEVFGEITGLWLYPYTWEVHEIIELVVLCGFITGGVLLWRGFQELEARNAEVELYLRAAQGEFFQMVQARFEDWGFTEAERDVALLTVKGLSVLEIAHLRNTSEGTIKSQNSSIYRKAGVKNRTQLLGSLIDELLVEPA